MNFIYVCVGIVTLCIVTVSVYFVIVLARLNSVIREAEKIASAVRGIVQPIEKIVAVLAGLKMMTGLNLVKRFFTKRKGEC